MKRNKLVNYSLTALAISVMPGLTSYAAAQQPSGANNNGGLIGFKLDFWDYATFLVLILSVAIVLVFLIWLAGLPGRIAIARQHPDAEAVKIMGYAGFFTVVAWVQAFMWAFKPTDVVDIRRYPLQEQRAIELEIAKLKGENKASENKEGQSKEGDHKANKGSADKEKPS